MTEHYFKPVIYSPAQNLVYINNQKAGCTSVKYSLWQDADRRMGVQTFKGKTHDLSASPFVHGYTALKAALGQGDSALAKAAVFTVVRNPFHRALSVYLHHVAAGGWWARLQRRFEINRSQKLQHDFLRKAGLPPTSNLSFDAYLDALEGVQQTRLTGHFRAQTLNTLWGDLAFDAVLRLEDSTAITDFMASHGVDMQARVPHAQNASDRHAEFFTPHAIAKVASIFADDFVAFGYDPTDPAAPAPSMAGAPITSPKGAQPLSALVQVAS